MNYPSPLHTYSIKAALAALFLSLLRGCQYKDFLWLLIPFHLDMPVASNGKTQRLAVDPAVVTFYSVLFRIHTELLCLKPIMISTDVKNMKLFICHIPDTRSLNW